MIADIAPVTGYVVSGVIAGGLTIYLLFAMLFPERF